MSASLSFSVSQLTDAIRLLLESSFSSVTVEGEVSKPTIASSGHVYFTLKDDGAQLACVIWRSTAERFKLQLEHGQQLSVGGSIQVYPPTGRYQLIVNRVALAGEGQLQRAFLALKQKLEAEGLFDTSKKRPLPRFPQHIGIVTSATGAAFQDICNTLERRWPSAQLSLYHASVQGVNAAAEIVNGIRYFSDHPVDVLIVGRGGGSLEDLWCFNEEVVARAISACPVPVISAVGHETDFSISDFVADVRAATPTQAVMMAVPDQFELRMRLDELWMKSNRQAITTIGRLSEKVLRLQEKTGRRALIESIHRKRDRVTSLRQQALNNLRQQWNRQHFQVQLLRERLLASDPNRPLQLGYTRVVQQGQWIRSHTALDATTFEIQWMDGVEQAQKLS